MQKDRLGRGAGKTALALLVYLIGFALAALAHALPFIRQGSYFIWSADAYTQHFPAFCYIQDYWHQLIAQLLAGDLRPAMFDFSLGLGGDIWTTLNYYGLGNPFYLLALPVQPQHYPLAFSLLLVLQFCLGGVGFYFLARRLGAQRWSAVAGSWLYALAGFYPMAVQHPIIAHAIFYLPLLLLGTEKLLHRESPLLLGLTVFFMGITGFYFLFICSIVLAFYVLIRTWQLRDGGSWWPVLWRGAVRSLAAYLAGLLMSCAVFLPQVIGFLGSNRTSDGTLPPLFSGFGALADWLRGALTPGGEPFAGAAGLLALAVTLGGGAALRKNRGAFAAGTLIGAAFLVSPFLQSALVGFGSTGYARFWFALAALPAMALALGADDLFCLNRVQLLCAAAVPVLGALALAQDGFTGNECISLAFVLALLLVLLAGRKLRRRAAAGLLAAVALANVSWALYAQADGLPEGSYRNERFARLMPAVTRDTLPEGEYRVDVAEVADHQWWASGNAAMVGGYKGLSEYFSILSADYTNAMLHDWALAPAQQGAFSFQSLDGCAALNTLAAVKYVFVRPGQEAYVPYGYSYVGTTPQAPVFSFVPDGGAELLRYENLCMLPMAYSYPAAMQESGELRGLEKQAAMMQLAVLETVPAGAAQAEPDLSCVAPVQSEVLPGAGVSWQDGELVSAGGDGTPGTLTLSFEAPAGGEIHLLLTGCRQLPGQGEVWLSFQMDGGMERRVRMSDAVDPEKTWVNLGYAGEGGERTVTLTLPDGYRLGLDGLEVWSYDMAAFDAAAQQRSAGALKNILVEKNSIQGLSESETDRIVVFSVPWSEGWSASIDGQPAELTRANSMFCGLAVPAGSHAVRLYYTTPGFRAGAVCSVLGLAALGGQWIFWLYRKRKAA